jgi:hypothetical protein
LNISDKELLSAGLFATKHMAMVYNNTASETDDLQIAGELCQMISDEHTARIRLFEALRQRGWYNTQLIEQQQLQTAQQQLSQQLRPMQAQAGAVQQTWQGPSTYSQLGNTQQSRSYQGGYSPYQVGGSSQQQGSPPSYGQQPGYQQSEPIMGVQTRSPQIASPSH